MEREASIDKVRIERVNEGEEEEDEGKVEGVRDVHNCVRLLHISEVARESSAFTMPENGFI